MRRILDTQRAWIDGARMLAYRTAIQLDVAKYVAEPKNRERAKRWYGLVTPVLIAACTRQAFYGASKCAFRRHVLPEFEMRLGMIKRACDGVIAAQVAA